MYQQIAANKRKTIYITLIFIGVVLFLGWIFGQILETGSSWLIAALLISSSMSWFGYYHGDKLALWSSGAQPITKTENPYLYRIVENLCLTAGQPLPKIHLIDDPAPNAFATGRNPEHASIAVTTGLMNRLTNEELEGVIAHELSHIKNYDILVMTLILVMAGTITLISDWFLRSLWWSRRDHKNNAGVILFVVGLVLAVVSPLIGKLIQLAVSRRREYLADASGALLTRYPEGLASALEKIAAFKEPLQRANHATAHLYINNPFGNVTKFLDRLFSTHPPIEDRIKILRSL